LLNGFLNGGRDVGLAEDVANFGSFPSSLSNFSRANLINDFCPGTLPFSSFLFGHLGNGHLENHGRDGLPPSLPCPAEDGVNLES
jgi:hypothetical protein